MEKPPTPTPNVGDEIEIPPGGTISHESEIDPDGKPTSKNCRAFIKGPLDWGWVTQAYAAGGSGLLVSLDVLRRAGMSRPGEWLVANPTSLSHRMSRSCYTRSLARLEEAGLILVDRKPGAAARVKVIQLSPEVKSKPERLG